jgi:hypothetical protein
MHKMQFNNSTAMILTEDVSTSAKIVSQALNPAKTLVEDTAVEDLVVEDFMELVDMDLEVVMEDEVVMVGDLEEVDMAAGDMAEEEDITTEGMEVEEVEEDIITAKIKALLLQMSSLIMLNLAVTDQTPFMSQMSDSRHS